MIKGGVHVGISNQFDKQWQLDAENEQKQPVPSGEDRMPKKLLALQIELGELVNEFRSFKFWSNDQEPRIKSQSFIHKVDRFTDEVSYRNPLLEKIVDCLHFILSIGNDLNFKEFHLVDKYSGELHDTVNMF